MPLVPPVTRQTLLEISKPGYDMGILEDEGVTR
jgi:hypothetical protein